MAIDTGLVSTGFGVAFMAVGASVALGAMKDIMPRKGISNMKNPHCKPMFTQPKPFYFKPIKW